MANLEIALDRSVYSPQSTIGIITIGDRHWYSLEDATRKVKIPGVTAIPAGRYQVVPFVFSSVHQIRPMLLDVPNYVGIFIHVGNRHEDTKGCILPGRNYGHNYVFESNAAYGEICTYLCNAWANKREAWITISDKEGHAWADEMVA